MINLACMPRMGVSCIEIDLHTYKLSSYRVAGTVGLLLKDTQGDKSASLLTGFRKKKDVPVLRGSLLIAISPKDTPSGADAITYQE